MTNRYAPETGNWYKDETGASFEVILVDESEDTIEVQYFDGSLESFDLDTWRQMEVSRRAPPEDWSGPYDDLEPDDLDSADSAAKRHDWSDPLNMVESED